MKQYILFLLASILLFSCQPAADTDAGDGEEAEMTESDKLNAWFDQKWDEAVDRSPTWQTYMGIKKDYSEWDDMSDEQSKIDHERLQEDLNELVSNFDVTKLDEKTKVSYELWKDDAERELASFEFRFHNYPVNQMFGTHSWLPSFMMNMHRIDSLNDAQAYVKRLYGMKTVLDQLVVNLKMREAKGIIPPKFVFPLVIESCNNILKGFPLTETSETDCAFLADLKGKLDNITITTEEKDALTASAKQALKESVGPGYRGLISYLEELEQKATTEDGVWKFPNGGDYYNMRLANITTTRLTSDDIFDIGMSELKRIQAEMSEIQKKVGFEGSLQDFFKHMETSEQFYFENTDEGRQQYLDSTKVLIADMKKQLDGLFITKPKADMVVKRVEDYREKAAGKAFYQSPAPDGSRPGMYYVNLYDMTQMPVYQMEALAYHEAIPGHHMQNTISQELAGLPKFRTLGGGYTAYGEGWGLYSEYVPKELGFYKDPYSDFGRLAMELWRACRLVADVGIHSKKWTREEAIEFYSENTPNPYEDCVKMVERHVVMAGQATAYKIGQLKILELRESAKQQLGEAFDIREFHEVVLTNGALPLNVLEDMVNNYIASKKAA